MPAVTSKIDSIQALRAIAVILVVYAHSIDSSIEVFVTAKQHKFYYLENWGSIGLDLFFVISGFIMTRIIHSYEKGRGWKLFAYKRALRIIPLYWGISLVATLLISRTYHIKLATFVKTLFFFPIFESEFEFPVIGAGWSLSYEIYFYLLITIVLLFHTQKPQSVVLTVVFCLSLAGFFFDSTSVLLRFLSSPLLIEFALGIGCGLVYDNFVSTTLLFHTIAVISFCVGLFGMVITIFFDYGTISEAEAVTSNNYLAGLRSVVWGVPCAFFLLGCVLLERLYSFDVPLILIRIGDASYSNYLLHGLLISFTHNTILNLNIGENTYIFSLLFLCTVVSLIMYYYVEKPMTTKLNNYFFPKKVIVTSNSA